MKRIFQVFGGMHRDMTSRALLLAVALVSSLGARADELQSGATWESIRKAGRSLVFGRLEGRFDGTDYRGRKLRVRSRETGKEHLVAVDPALGFFEAVLPTGTYELVSIEAVYFPQVKPIDPRRTPPVPQRYALRPEAGNHPPFFTAATEMPIYLGTIRSGVGFDGTVYQGHELSVVDEYEDAWRRLGERHPELIRSLAAAGVEPRQLFFLEPQPVELPLVLASGGDPLSQARSYIAERKFGQAIAWLETSMPLLDRERVETRILVGEALLGDGRFREAIEDLGEALLVEPENLRALRLLARAHALEGNAEDAFGLYRALAGAIPGDAESELHVGYRHALRSERAAAEEAFGRAFETNFDYLLHDVAPYALALKGEGARYEPPEVLELQGRLPSGMRSRRGARGAFALLLDHEGGIVAAHVSSEAESWASATLMTAVRARFKPAKLNGVPIPCLVIVGAEDLGERAR